MLRMKPVLTDREKEILGLLADGKDCGDIVLILGIKRNTVSQGITKVLDKFGCNEPVGAVLEAMKWGMLPLPTLYPEAEATEAEQAMTSKGKATTVPAKTHPHVLTSEKPN